MVDRNGGLGCEIPWYISFLPKSLLPAALPKGESARSLVVFARWLWIPGLARPIAK